MTGEMAELEEREKEHGYTNVCSFRDDETLLPAIQPRALGLVLLYLSHETRGADHHSISCRNTNCE